MSTKVGQPMSTSWSTSSQPDFVRALGRRITARNRQGKILYTELLKSWSTLGQLLANSPTLGSCKGPPCSGPLATPEKVLTIFGPFLINLQEYTKKLSRLFFASDDSYPRDPDTLKTVRAMNLLSVMNSLCVVI